MHQGLKTLVGECADMRAVDEVADAADTSAPSQIILVQNWFEELRRLVPTN